MPDIHDFMPEQNLKVPLGVAISSSSSNEIHTKATLVFKITKTTFYFHLYTRLCEQPSFARLGTSMLSSITWQIQGKSHLLAAFIVIVTC